jgi:dolichol kinase
MNPEALALTFSILAAPIVLIVGIFVLVVLDAVAATQPRVPGRHRAPRVIDGEVLANDTVPIVISPEGRRVR